MSLWHRYRRWRGADTVETIFHVQEVYEYEIETAFDGVKRPLGHRHTESDGFLHVKEFTGERWARKTMNVHAEYTGPPAFDSRSWEDVGRYGNITEYDRERVAIDVWAIHVDLADKSYETDGPTRVQW